MSWHIAVESLRVVHGKGCGVSDIERQELSAEKLICQQYVLECKCISVYSPLQQCNKRQYVLQILFVKQCWDSSPINTFIVNIELLSLLGLLKVPIVLWMTF